MILLPNVRIFLRETAVNTWGIIGPVYHKAVQHRNRLFMNSLRNQSEGSFFMRRINDFVRFEGGLRNPK